MVAAGLYCSPAAVLAGRALVGFDFRSLHEHRIAYLRESLLERGTIPEWSPLEFLGAPFLANVQSVPWTPMRWVLLLVPPEWAYTLAVPLAAALAAFFTALLGMRLGLSPSSAAVAGVTWAASGYFAARVVAGHLPLLEAYPALPMLLWLGERALVSKGRTRDLVALSAGTLSTCLSGHPQLPFYAVGATIVYCLWRSGRRSARVVTAMVLGVGASAFAWSPMVDLVAQSTRVLPLNPPGNDFCFPWARLPSLLWPWRDGAPSVLRAGGEVGPFKTYPVGLFYDTFNYVGVLPLVALLSVGAWVRTEHSRAWRGLAVLAVSALALSLPTFEAFRELVPITVLRSPARLMFVPTLGICLALGRACDWASSRLPAPALARQALIGVVVLAHLLDVGGVARRFVVTEEPLRLSPGPFAGALHGLAPGQRVAIDRTLGALDSSSLDDVGGFDSAILGGTYLALMKGASLPPGANVQTIEGWALSTGTLAETGVRWVITRHPRTDLPQRLKAGNLTLYEVPSPIDRVTFWPAGSNAATPARWRRPRPERFEIDGPFPSGGAVRVLEAPAVGWAAEVDGLPTSIDGSDGLASVITVPPGANQVTLTFRTPGRRRGYALTVLVLAALAVLLRRPSKADPAGGPSKAQP